MNNMKVLRLLGALLAIIWLTTSCSPTRKIIREPLKEHGTDFLFNNLKANELNYTYFSARFNSSFKQDKSETTLSGQLRIQRDSAIWISVSPLMGIEMIRILITNDSIYYVNRIDNTYFEGSFDHINKMINSTFDFDMLQSFLTGNDFSRYENTSFRGSIDNREYKLATTNRRRLKKFVNDTREVNIPIQHIWLNPESFKISRIMVKEVTSSERKAEARYTHNLIDAQLVPSSIIFDVETDAKKTSIEIVYSKVNLKDRVQFPFKIPEKYQKVDKL